MQVKNLVTVVSLGVAGVTLQAQAAGEWYVSPSVSYVLNDDHRAKDHGWGVGLALGKAVTDAWNVELSSRYLRLDGKDDEMASVGLDALFFINRDPAFAPYVLMGLGYAKEGSSNSGSNSNLMGNIGAGFVRQLSNNLDLRGDVRYHLHDNRKEALEPGNLGDWLVSFGVNYSLGK